MKIETRKKIVVNIDEKESFAFGLVGEIIQGICEKIDDCKNCPVERTYCFLDAYNSISSKLIREHQLMIEEKVNEN